MEKDSLQAELRVFELHRTEWLPAHRGKFVAIVGTNVIGFYPDFESAFKAGLPAVGHGNDFLLKQVLAEDPVYFVY